MIDDIECGELRRFIVRIIIAMIVYEVSLNFLIFKLCFSRACTKYRSYERVIQNFSEISHSSAVLYDVIVVFVISHT